MNLDAAVTRCAYAVDKALKSTFPDNFFARCMYASYGTQHLMEKLGFETRIVVGSFGMFLVSKDGKRATAEGYGGPGSENSHFWCVVRNRILDVCSPYLAENGQFSKAKPPIIFWPVEREMPRCFRYYYGGDLNPRSPETYDPDMQIRLKNFIEACDYRLTSVKGQPKLSNWLLSDVESLRRAGRKGDAWASAAIRLESGEGQLNFKSMLLHGDLREKIPI